MSTNDVSKHRMACPCGKSTVTFIDTSPDHPWARESQTSHDAEIDCQDCAQTYTAYSERFSNDVPMVVTRIQVEAKAAAEKAFWDYYHEIQASPEADRLRPRISEQVDAATSKAAAHRALRAMKLTYDSYGTYARRPYSGETAAKRAGGGDLARIGSGMLGGSDKPYFEQAAARLQKLEAAWRGSPLTPIKLRPVGAPVS